MRAIFTKSVDIARMAGSNSGFQQRARTGEAAAFYMAYSESAQIRVDCRWRASYYQAMLG